MTAPPMAYFGGKTRLADRLVAMLPPHGHYVEPFAGSLAVLLAKPISRMETVNDLDSDLMAFWRVLRDRTDDLARVCALTPHSRAEHQAAYEPASDDLERARRVWVRITQGRAGTLRKTGWRHYVDPGGSTSSMSAYLDGYVERMAVAAARLARVSLECRPALDLIERYGQHDGVCLYVDPPYLGTLRSGSSYATEMAGAGEHADLLDALLQCKAAVVLSGYASELYDSALGGWERVEIPTTTGQGGVRSERTEVVWSNRRLTPAPTLFDEVPS